MVIETVSAIGITMFKTGGLIKVRGKGKAVVSNIQVRRWGRQIRSTGSQGQL